MATTFHGAFAAEGETDDKRAAIPAVQLSAGHASLCHVRVGDEMPAPKRPGLDGVEVDPAELLGAQATVVVLWQGNRPMTRMLLADLGPDVLEPFSKKGVKVVGVAIGQDAMVTRGQLTAARAVAATAAGAKATFPVLLDSDGTAFALVGKKMLPRIYVLDPDGRIVWFDIEYSQATRRELGQTLHALTR